jgi:hypothetical protein
MEDMMRVSKMATEELEQLSEKYNEADELTETEMKLWDAVERELDARELSDHEDARVRESVGRY